MTEAAPRILEAICDAMGWEYAGIWAREASVDQLRCVTTHHKTERAQPFADNSRGMTLSRGQGFPGKVWAELVPLWIPDVTKDASFVRADEAEKAGLHGAFAIPIFERGRFYGALEFFSGSVYEPDDELTSILSDIGARLGSFIEREHMDIELRFQKALLQYQGDAALDGIGVISNDLRILYWNKRALEMFGVSEEEAATLKLPDILLKVVAQTADPAEFDDLATSVLSDPESSRQVEIEMADGRFIDIWTAPVKSPEGILFGRAVYARDVTQRKREEEWSAFLAEASRVLTESLDVEVVLNRLAKLMVPTIADWCSIHLVDETGEVVPFALAHSDEETLKRAQQVQERYPPDPRVDTGVVGVIRSASPLLLSEIPDELITTGAHDEEHAKLLFSFGLRSALVVPIKARDKVLGAVALMTAESKRRLDDSDLERATQLADRAGFAIDNARVYLESNKVARTLQKSFLPPELPELPGVEIAARYFAMGENQPIGGDFYDAFAIDKRRWGLALGDVSGKGLEAATITTLARHVVRGAALKADEPSEVLAVLNKALVDQTQTDRFCTAVYAITEPRFARVKVTISSGGHPPPYVIRNDGTIEPINCNGMLLGFMDKIELIDATVELEFGDKLFLYTDGILDIRTNGNGGTFGPEGLEKLLYEASKRGTEAAADFLSTRISELQAGKSTDDIAFILIGVRSSVFNIPRRRFRFVRRLLRRKTRSRKLNASSRSATRRG